MRILFALCVILFVTSAETEPAVGANHTFVNHGISASVNDTATPLFLPGIYRAGIDVSEGILSSVDDAEQVDGGAFATAALQYKVGKGSISLYAAAFASAQNNSFFGVQLTGGQGGANADTSISDRWSLATAGPVATAQVQGYFKISSSLNADAIGVPGTLGNDRDRVQSEAIARLSISGTGIPPGPYAYLGKGNDLWAYREHREGYNASVTDINLPLTVTEIPVVVNVTGGSALVGWSMNVAAVAGVSNTDVTNYTEGAALASVDASHTFSWGGITNVIDLSTGEPIADWTLTSDSGFDWTHAAVIPEPTTSALALLAFVGLVVYRRRIHAEKSSRPA